MPRPGMWGRSAGAGVAGGWISRSSLMASPPSVPWDHHRLHRRDRGGGRGPALVAAARCRDRGQGVGQRPTEHYWWGGGWRLFRVARPRSLPASSEPASTGSTLRSSGSGNVFVPLPYPRTWEPAALPDVGVRQASEGDGGRIDGGGDPAALGLDGGGHGVALDQVRGRRSSGMETSSSRLRPTRRTWSTSRIHRHADRDCRPRGRRWRLAPRLLRSVIPGGNGRCQAKRAPDRRRLAKAHS